jgi:hypothetical protein
MNTSPWMPRPLRLGLRAAAAALLLGLACLLAACGGGESEEDAHKATNPPHCEQRPELCQ